MAKSTSLVHSPELLAFLSYPDGEFDKFKSVYILFIKKNEFAAFIEEPTSFMNKGKSKTLSALSTPTGTAEGRLDSDIRKLSRDIGIFIVDTYEEFSRLVEICETIEVSLSKAAEAFGQLSKSCETISSKYNLVSEINKYTEFGKIAELYQSLSDTFQVQSNLLLKETASISKDIKMMFDFDLKEIEGLETVGFFKPSS